MIDRLLKLLDDDLDLALSEIDKLDLGNYRGMYI